jgi:hypothetical protein
VQGEVEYEVPPLASREAMFGTAACRDDTIWDDLA